LSACRAAVPLSAYIVRVLAGERTLRTPILRPVERLFYATAGVDPAREQNWRPYALAMPNLGPTSKALVERVNAAIEAEFAAGRIDIVAADAATTSGSGLDPHISPQFALAQVPTVAAARGLPEAKLRALVEQRIEQRFAGFIGEPRANVLELDLALDELR
jgi:K+-transporting ATPase KdpC subunit